MVLCFLSHATIWILLGVALYYIYFAVVVAGTYYNPVAANVMILAAGLIIITGPILSYVFRGRTSGEQVRDLGSYFRSGRFPKTFQTSFPIVAATAMILTLFDVVLTLLAVSAF